MYVVLTHAVGFLTLMVVYWYTLVRGNDTSYMTSPLWLDIPLVPHIVILQVVAMTCLVAWVATVQQSLTPPSPLVYGASIGYYAFSILWPFLATRFIQHPSCARALAASFPLWGAGICVMLLLHTSTETLERLLMVPIVVLAVVCDAILWTLAALRRSRQ